MRKEKSAAANNTKHSKLVLESPAAGPSMVSKFDPSTASFDLGGNSTVTFSTKIPGSNMNTMPGMPVITSNDNQPGSAIVWVTD
ncbi:hypothetical protein HDU98_003163, partial [Podochytrium sp. JEL0797]